MLCPKCQKENIEGSKICAFCAQPFANSNFQSQSSKEAEASMSPMNKTNARGTKNAVLMRMARESLKGKWGLAIVGGIVFGIFEVILNFIPYIGPIANLIIAGPLILGYIIFNLSLSRNQNAKIEQIFQGFNRFKIALEAFLTIVIFTFLWTLLFIVPGIIAGLSYRMTFYIIADDNSISASEAIEKSKKMMMGYKGKLFLMFLTFAGLGLLCLLTLGIGFIWLFPYASISVAKFYDDIKGNQLVTQKPSVENELKAIMNLKN